MTIIQVGKAHCKRVEGGQVVTDKATILTDLQLMGEGLVKKVEILTAVSE